MIRCLVSGIAACAVLSAAAAPWRALKVEARPNTCGTAAVLPSPEKDATVGSLTPVGLDAPATQQLTGADSYAGSYLSWSVAWQMNWDLFQTWSIDPTTPHAQQFGPPTNLNRTARSSARVATWAAWLQR